MRKENAVAAVALTLTILLMLATTFCACSSDSKNKIVRTDGSTSMEKVIGALGEQFETDNSSVTFTYNPTGSGSGITAVYDGLCDIGLSSRLLKEEEINSGLEQTVFAYDAMVVIVNNDNPVSDLDLDVIAQIYTGQVTNWKSVGGSNEDIVVIGREVNSGTREGFELATGTADSCVYRQELTSAGDVITAVANNSSAIGYTSLASVKDSVKAISIDGVEVSEDTVSNGSYAIKRPFVLVTKADTPLSQTAQDFFDYCLSEEAKDIILQMGAIPAS